MKYTSNLRYPITIQRKPTKGSRDDMGAVSDPVFQTIFENIRSNFKFVLPSKESEIELSDQITGVSYYMFYVRTDPTTKQIRPKDRLVLNHTGETYDIQSVSPIDANDKYRMIYTKIVGSQGYYNNGV